jgi:small subunit ribosomal protein S9
VVNGKAIKDYFPYFEHQAQVREPLAATGREDLDVTVVVRGGGVRGQAEAVRLGIARALVAQNEDVRPVLRASHLLTRDPRVKERKKYGLKRARRAPQWQKR